MKHKITFALCAGLLLAGFFGLVSVSESDLSFCEAVGAILGICAAELPVIHLANKTVEK